MFAGFDGLVYIYETDKWSSDGSCDKKPSLVTSAGGDTNHPKSPPPVTPAFTHRGHHTCLEDKYSSGYSEGYSGVLTTLHHSWHIAKPHLVLSSASDGSLHAWNYVCSDSERAAAEGSTRDADGADSSGENEDTEENIGQVWEVHKDCE